MITYAKYTQKQKVMDAWRTAFPTDSEEFVDFYFEKKYRNENTLLLLKDFKMASCLQILPYRMTYYGKLVNCAYISGAMTLPEYQNQGLMKELFVYTLKEMRKKGNAVTAIIPQEPWLIDFYKKFDYIPCFEYELTAVNPSDYPPFPDKMTLKEFEFTDLRNAYPFYKKHFEQQNLCVQKSYPDFSVMAQVCQNFEGKVYLLIDEEEMVGVCFCFLSDGKVVLKDCITKNEDYQQYFLSKLIRLFDNQPVFLYSSVKDASNSVFLGMARILDAPKLLSSFAKANPQVAFSIKIHDEYVAENNVTLSVCDGKMYEETRFQLPTVDFELPIEKVTQLLLGYRTAALEEKYAIFPQRHPYMSLMLE